MHCGNLQFEFVDVDDTTGYVVITVDSTATEFEYSRTTTGDSELFVFRNSPVEHVDDIRDEIFLEDKECVEESDLEVEYPLPVEALGNPALPERPLQLPSTYG